MSNFIDTIKLKSKKPFIDLNYLYFENGNDFKNQNFKIIKRYQAPLDEIVDVFYIVEFMEDYQICIKPDRVECTVFGNENQNICTEFMSYIESLTRKIKIEKILENDN